MTVITNSNFTILDLADEILSIIFRKLNVIDIFYSLVNVNRRFERLALDPLHLHNVDLTDMTAIKSLNNETSVDTRVLPSICENILPRIHEQIHLLTVEKCSMKEVLRAATYPQLYSLSLWNFDEKILLQSLTDDLILRDLLSKQITHLNIDITPSTSLIASDVAEIFQLILSLCNKLIVLNFGDIFLGRSCDTMVVLRLQNCMSSTLIKLKISVATFTDCLLLLDGRLNSLSTLIITVPQIFDPAVDISEGRKLPKLKCFSFTSFDQTFDYDGLIVPLLCRMINLEELQLYLSVGRFDGNYIDGIQLYDQFLIHMTQLNKFSFNIETKVYNNENIGAEMQSNEEIQNSFTSEHYQRVASYVFTDSTKTSGQCRIYSLPFTFDCFTSLNNSFQGGIFDRVRCVTMSDTDSFEYRLFKLVSHDFPFLEFLYISNSSSQKGKMDPSTQITFPHLTFLSLQSAHDDYAEQFLLQKNTHLPRLLNLRIQYQSLRTITNNFTKDAKQLNFGTLKNLDACGSFVHPTNFNEYFPLL